MGKIKIGLRVLAVAILAISGTTTAVASIIPVAHGKIIPVADIVLRKEEGKGPRNSPLIDMNPDGFLVLSLPNIEEPGFPAPGIPVLDVPLGVDVDSEFPGVFSTGLMQEQVGLSDGSGFAVVPEPATLLLLGLGGVMLRKKMRMANSK